MTGVAAKERVLEDCVRPDCLDRIHEALGEMWAEVPTVSEADRLLFELAVIEVAGNVVRHGNSGETFDCQIIICVSDTTLSATFCDNGVEAQVDISNAELPDDLAENGRGLAMARDALDELTYQRAGGINRWRLTRQRAA